MCEDGLLHIELYTSTTHTGKMERVKQMVSFRTSARVCGSLLRQRESKKIPYRKIGQGEVTVQQETMLK